MPSQKWVHTGSFRRVTARIFIFIINIIIIIINIIIIIINSRVIEILVMWNAQLTSFKGKPLLKEWECWLATQSGAHSIVFRHFQSHPSRPLLDHYYCLQQSVISAVLHGSLIVLYTQDAFPEAELIALPCFVCCSVFPLTSVLDSRSASRVWEWQVSRENLSLPFLCLGRPS